MGKKYSVHSIGEIETFMAQVDLAQVQTITLRLGETVKLDDADAVYTVLYGIHVTYYKNYQGAVTNSGGTLTENPPADVASIGDVVENQAEF